MEEIEEVVSSSFHNPIVLDLSELENLKDKKIAPKLTEEEKGREVAQSIEH